MHRTAICLIVVGLSVALFAGCGASVSTPAPTAFVRIVDADESRLRTL